jgi:hypothetical protein
MGHELLEMIPVGFIVDRFAMIVAMVSYNGSLNFGLLGDYDALPDIDLITAYIQDALAELVAEAESSSAA